MAELVSATPTIAVVNSSTEDLGIDFDKLISVMQAYVDEVVSKLWGVTAKLVKAKKVPPNAWAMEFLSRTKQKDTEGYHLLTKTGFPLANVFVTDTIKAGDLVSVTGTHELGEMLVDPGANRWALDKTGKMAALESNDAVEETYFELNGVTVSNILTPQYFEPFHKPLSVKFDWNGEVEKPFQILPGGYSLVIDETGAIHEEFEDMDKANRFLQENRLGHRSQFRKDKYNAILKAREQIE